MSEIVYYENEQEGVLVSNARLISKGQTYSIGQISSVSLDRKPIGCLALGLIIGGAFLTMAGGITTLVFFFISSGGLGNMSICGTIIAFGILVAGILLAQSMRRFYVVKLTTPAGEVAAFESSEENVAYAVADALNKALIAQR